MGKYLISLMFTLLFTVSSHAGFEALNQGVSLDIFNRIDCTTGMSCSKLKDKLIITSTAVGVVNTIVAASTTTLTSAQCGSTIVYGATFVVSLPEASTVIGCRYTFVVNAVANMDINPDDADTILLLTNAAGDAIRADAVGETIVLEAINATSWVTVGAEKGTWSDID